MTEITGRVVHGKKYGRILGFPTANLDRRQYVRQKQKVKLGIWAGHVYLKPKAYKLKPLPAAIVIGPVDSKGLPKIEAHILDFKGDLYGQKLTFILNKYIRPFRKYKGEEELKKQITKDLEVIKNLK